MPLWTVLVPLVAAGLLGVSSLLGASVGMLALFGGALMLSVLAAVHHAEVIAHKVGAVSYTHLTLPTKA